MTQTHTIKTAALLIVLALTAGTATAVPQLDGVSFDPAFIAAGDRVNISVNLREPQTPDEIWHPDRQLRVVLKPGNRLAEQYVTIEDARDTTVGFLYPDGIWNKRFQVRVDSGAPTGSYDFELHISYLKDGEPVILDGNTTATFIRTFSMPVETEGVDISSTVLRTQPDEPRPGDDHVDIRFQATNTGSKPIEELDLRPSAPRHVTPSYTSDEKFSVSLLKPGQTATRTLSVDLDEDLAPGLHWIDLDASYEDRDGNPYSQQLQIPLRVEGRPDLEISNAQLTMQAGGTRQLRFTVTNTGSQDAEAVTARAIVERTQPFSLADRSAYIGEIEPGEQAATALRLSAERAASLQTHQLKLQLRTLGDSEEGDGSVYTTTATAAITLDGRTQSLLIPLGLGAALLVVAGAGYRYRKQSDNDSNGGE